MFARVGLVSEALAQDRLIVRQIDVQVWFVATAHFSATNTIPMLSRVSVSPMGLR